MEDNSREGDKKIAETDHRPIKLLKFRVAIKAIVEGRNS